MELKFIECEICDKNNANKYKQYHDTEVYLKEISVKTNQKNTNNNNNNPNANNTNDTNDKKKKKEIKRYAYTLLIIPPQIYKGGALFFDDTKNTTVTYNPTHWQYIFYKKPMSYSSNLIKSGIRIIYKFHAKYDGDLHLTLF